MLRTKYYLTDAKSAGETALYAACYLEGQRKKIYLATLTVKPEQWDAKAQKYRRNYAGFSDANHLLRTLAEGLKTAHLQHTAKGKVTTVEDLRAVAARFTSGKQAQPPAGLLEHLDTWIESAKRDRAPSTIKAYNTLRQHLISYSKLRRIRLEFASLDVAFCEAFKSYLLKTMSMGNASVNNQVKNLKVFLGHTFEQGVHEHAHFKRFRKMEAVAPEVVYLTAAEKARLFALPLAHLKYLEQTRDIFLFKCETGLRFSDVQALRAAQDLGPAGAHRHPTTTSQHKSSERVATTRPKYELIGTHTARRTFVTMALEGGMRPETLMRITGHKNYKVLHRYLKITDTVVQDEFAQYLERQERQARPAMRIAG